MARTTPCSALLQKILMFAVYSFGFTLLHPGFLYAQHGGHFGAGHVGAGAHIGGAPLGAPPTGRPAARWPVPLFHAYTRPPLNAAATRYFRLTEARPIYIFPNAEFHRFRHFGSAWGWGWGFNSLWWQSCIPLWYPQFTCTEFPEYGYGLGNYPTPQYYVSPLPLYAYAGDARELVELYFTDGSEASVTDYWVVDGQIHFTAVEQGAPNPVERVVDFNDLDLQKTIDVNTQRGFRIVLRNEPWQQYLKDHPDSVPPEMKPPAGAPPERK